MVVMLNPSLSSRLSAIKLSQEPGLSATSIVNAMMLGFSLSSGQSAAKLSQELQPQPVV